MNPKKITSKIHFFKYIIGTTLIFSMILGLFFWSCKHEIDQPVEILSVDEAQQWFESQSNQAVMLKSGKTKPTLELKEDWGNARASGNDTLGIVETDILSRGQFNFMFQDSTRRMDSSGNNYPTSYSKLVIQKNKRTGEMESFIMTLIAPSDYLEKHNFDLRKNSYLKRQKDFTGMVLYHSISGEFVNGWSLKNGKVAGICNQVDNKPIPSRLKQQAPIATTCLVITIEYWQQDCKLWYSNGRLTSASCGAWYVYDTYSYESCDYDIGGGYGSGDSGGYYVNSTNYHSYIFSQFDDYPCGAAAFEKLIDGNTSLSQILHNVFNTSDQVNLTFAPKDLPDSESGLFGPGTTFPDFYCYINTNVLNKSSQPYILATMLHEGLHAYFGYMKVIDPDFYLRYPCLDTNSNGELIYIPDKALNNIPINQSLLEHSYMANYVQQIANVLTSAYPSLSNAEALALSWGGLEGTRAFRLNKENLDKFIPNEYQNYIITVNQAHKESGCGEYHYEIRD